MQVWTLAQFVPKVRGGDCITGALPTGVGRCLVNA